jgi:non-heme chloroperoxidase
MLSLAARKKKRIKAQGSNRSKSFLVPFFKKELLLLSVFVAVPAMAADRTFVTSDGVRLHYIDQGQGPPVVMVPGWTMPAWIFRTQIDDLSRHYRVIAFDPRGQGDSDIPTTGYEPLRRGRDIADLLDHLGDRPPVLLGWSLGVLDVLAYVHQFGDSRLAGLILVDNSVGAGPAPVPTARGRRWRRARPEVSREVSMRSFVRGMFVEPQPAEYLTRLTDAALRTPADAAYALRHYNEPREFWKDAIDATGKPILYVVTPHLQAQADDLTAHHPGVESVVLRGVGHAMFVDDPAEFDRLVMGFLSRRVWH